jgi:signal transduction histidine kinase
MKRRYLYVWLFAVPALLAALVVSLLLFGAAAGALWIFVLGDNPWPATASGLLVGLLVVACLTLWLALLSVAYAAGKQREAQRALNPRHVMASVGATALLVLLGVAQQWGVGNLGAKSDGILCSEFCTGKGFMGSGMPPRDSGVASCSCFDAQGREALQLPLADIAAARGQ